MSDVREVFRPMSEAEFATALAEAAEFARTRMVEQPAPAFETTLLVHLYRQETEGGIALARTVMPLPGFQMIARDTLLANIGLRFGQERTLIPTIFFLFQTWVGKGQVKKERKAGMPTAEDVLGNVVMVMGSTLDERAASARLAFTRDGMENLVPGATLLLPYGQQPDGRLMTYTRNLSSPFFRGYKAGALGALAKMEGRFN